MKVDILLAASVLLVASFGQQGAGAGDEGSTSGLNELLQEIKALRIQMQRLESRIERLEQTVGKNDLRDLPLHAPKLPGEGPPSVFEWHQHEMPWSPSSFEHDKGLYVFPGLDAPSSRR